MAQTTGRRAHASQKSPGPAEDEQEVAPGKVGHLLGAAGERCASAGAAAGSRCGSGVGGCCNTWDSGTSVDALTLDARAQA
eukprot:1944829-Heterocapsa_arctica.AAC.1